MQSEGTETLCCVSLAITAREQYLRLETQFKNKQTNPSANTSHLPKNTKNTLRCWAYFI